MECMEGKALRSSLRSESTQDELVGEIFYNTATHTAVSSLSAEDSLVDQFLNLQNGDHVEVEVEEDQQHDYDYDYEYEAKHYCCHSSIEDDNSISNLSQLASELAVPDDDIAELEWVSHFVDDCSINEFPVYGSMDEKSERAVEVKSAAFSSVPVRPRTKRARPASRASESSSSTSTSSSSSSSSSRQRRRRAGGGEVQFQRRCSHCQVMKTPQWRTGPMGAKTLCNACGVRFKSGRLFPEYRPACSPTFSTALHSNSHRKVVEMRKKKHLPPHSHIISTF